MSESDHLLQKSQTAQQRYIHYQKNEEIIKYVDDVDDNSEDNNNNDDDDEGNLIKHHNNKNNNSSSINKRNTVKWKVIISCATWGFLTGVERAIILPTLWLFLFNKFGGKAAESYYGAALGAFNFSVLVFAPAYGLLAYKGFRTKFLLVVSNQMEIIGNIIYFAASQPWMVLIGRFICGVGSGSEVPLYADVVRITEPKERTFFIIILLLARQVGLIIGPSFTLLFHPVHLMIGQIMLNIYNSPGFFMSIMWSLHTLLVLVTYPDLAKDGSIIDSDCDNKINSDIRLEQKLLRKVYRHQNSSDLNGLALSKPSIVVRCRRYSTYVTIALLFAVHGIYFCLMATEAVLPPVTVRYFNWTEVENSLVYLVAGVLVVLIFSALQLISRYMGDRYLLIGGLAVLLIGYLWMVVLMGVIVTIGQPADLHGLPASALAAIRSDLNMTHFNASSVHQSTSSSTSPLPNPATFISLTMSGLLLHVIGMSLTVATAESLFTKSLPANEMDLAQSVLRTVINFSLLIGPFVAGYLQSYPTMVFLIMFGSVFLPFVMVIVKFNSFNLQ